MSLEEPAPLADDVAGGEVDHDALATLLGDAVLAREIHGNAEGFVVRPDDVVDISNPRNPTEVHRLPSSATVRNADVKFDSRDGLYYRSQEPNTGDADFAGVEIVDYGWGDGTLGDPEIVGTLAAGPTHNLFAHPEADVVYTTNEPEDPGGIDVFDVSDPQDPTLVRKAGPQSDLHDMVIDPEEDLMHCAFIDSEFLDGYVIMDVSDPTDPQEIGRFDYDGRPDYTEERLENGEPGFENCHYANYDSERGVVYVGDEIGFGVPGGKHVFDIGWADGSPSDPRHIGFTYSPNARIMDEIDELFDWTGHNFDVIPRGSNSMLVSGDYHEGTVVYDVSDPTDPAPTDQYRTDDKADVVEENGTGPLFPVGEPPMAWGVDYADERDFAVVSDMVTGVYVFKFTPSAAEGS